MTPLTTLPDSEAVERERVKFEARFPMPRDCIWTGNGYAQTEYHAWDAQAYQRQWEGWLAASEGREEAMRLLARYVAQDEAAGHPMTGSNLYRSARSLLSKQGDSK